MNLSLRNIFIFTKKIIFSLSVKLRSFNTLKPNVIPALAIAEDETVLFLDMISSNSASERPWGGPTGTAGGGAYPTGGGPPGGGKKAGFTWGAGPGGGRGLGGRPGGGCPWTIGGGATCGGRPEKKN